MNLVCLLVEKGYGAGAENFSFLFAERDARTLFVKNLPYRVTEEEMKNVFENALEVRLVLNKEGSSKGCVAEKLLGVCCYCILMSLGSIPFNCELKPMPPYRNDCHFLCCRMAYIEFKTEAEAEKALEEKQGTEVDGRAMVIDYTGEKSQQENQKGMYSD